VTSRTQRNILGTRLKIWLFARSEEGKNIKNTCKKAWKIVSHNKLNLKLFSFLKRKDL
jgi:hypothetical protein